MFNPVEKVLTLLRARWRWAHGHCPLCNRNLYAAFPNSLADDPNCPACKGQTQTELRMGMWGGLADYPAEMGLSSDPAPVGGMRGRESDSYAAPG
jgi:hypothetical protein